MSANLTLDVLSDTKHPFVTDSYEFVNTKDVITSLDKVGYRPVKTAITKTRNPLAQAYAKHTVAFQREDAQMINGVVPQLHVINSYDGSTSLRFEFGMLRLVCSNGLVMKDGHSESIKMKHNNINASLEQVLEVLHNGFNQRQSTIKELMNTHISKSQAEEIAYYSILDRFGRELDELDYNKMIMANRYEDVGPNAWCFYNTIQENIIKGNKNITYRGSDRAIKDDNGIIIDYKESYRTLPPLRDFEKEFEVNKNLYDKVLEVAL